MFTIVCTTKTNNSKDNKRNLYFTLGGLGVVSVIGALGYYWWKSTQKTIKLLLCGAPGSGKGTQCEKLVKKYNVVHISTGDLLRQAIDDNTELGSQAKSFMDAGKLVPDHLVIGIVNTKLTTPQVQKSGWILDGFPRTEAQARALSELGADPSHIILLNVQDQELEKRITGRRVDPNTSKIYHIHYNPPPEDIKHRLIQRSDDTVEKLRTRLKAYHENINFIMDFYRKHSSKPLIRELDGRASPDHIFAEIEKELSK